MGPVMARRVLSAAVGSLLVLVALLTAVHKCQCSYAAKSTKAVYHIPNSYTILSAAVYEDPACSTPSSRMRGTPNSPVTCNSSQATDATPRLTDGILGPDSPTSPTTDYAYTLAGSSQFGQFETWITFDFTSRVSLASVTLHYYCTGQTPQLQLNDGSGVETPPVSPPCDSTAQRQCFTFSVSISTMQVNLKVLRNSNAMYISEVELFKESSTHTTDCCTNVIEMLIATPSSNQLGPLSRDITSTLPNSSQTTVMATPKTSPPSNNTSAVAGAVAGVVAGLVVCIAVAMLLSIACFSYMRRRNINTKGDDSRGLENYTSNYSYKATAEGNASLEHPEETSTVLINPLYDTDKGTDSEPTDHHYTATDGPHYNTGNKDSRASPSTGQTTLNTPTAVYHGCKTSMDTYSVPFGPDTDTYTVPVNQTQKGGQAGDRAAMELEGGGSEKSDTTAGAVYAVVDKKRKEKHRAMAASEEREAELEKSVATANAVYAVVDKTKKKEAPPLLPPPYQLGD